MPGCSLQAGAAQPSRPNTLEPCWTLRVPDLQDLRGLHEIVDVPVQVSRAAQIVLKPAPQSAPCAPGIKQKPAWQGDPAQGSDSQRAGLGHPENQNIAAWSPGDICCLVAWHAPRRTISRHGGLRLLFLRRMTIGAAGHAMVYSFTGCQQRKEVIVWAVSSKSAARRFHDTSIARCVARCASNGASRKRATARHMPQLAHAFGRFRGNSDFAVASARASPLSRCL